MASETEPTSSETTPVSGFEPAPGTEPRGEQPASGTESRGEPVSDTDPRAGAPLEEPVARPRRSPRKAVSVAAQATPVGPLDTPDPPVALGGDPRGEGSDAAVGDDGGTVRAGLAQVPDEDVAGTPKRASKSAARTAGGQRTARKRGASTPATAQGEATTPAAPDEVAPPGQGGDEPRTDTSRSERSKSGKPKADKTKTDKTKAGRSTPGESDKGSRKATHKGSKAAKRKGSGEPTDEAAASGADAVAPEGSGAGETPPPGSQPDAASATPTDLPEAAAAPSRAIATFGLLFQAPEQPLRAPRRRAEMTPVPGDEEPFASADATEAPDAAAQAESDVAESDVAGSEHADGDTDSGGRGSRRRRGGRGRRAKGSGPEAASEHAAADITGETTEESSQDLEAGSPAGPDELGDEEASSSSSRRRRRRRRSGVGEGESEDPPGTVTRVRESRARRDEPTAVKGSTRLEAKKLRRREGREAGRRRTIITEAEFLARRESVERVMVVRGLPDRTQIGVLEDGVLVEHYVSRPSSTTLAGNVYLGRVQNVLPSMEAAFVDIGKGRNAVLYAGEVNWDAAGLEVGQVRRIENALTSGDAVLVQVTKDPIGHKGARLTSQISLPGRFLVYVPEGQMTGISRKLPDNERARLKTILKRIVPDSAGVIVRTAAEGASEEELRADVERLTKEWERIRAKADAATARKSGSGGAPLLIHGEPDLTVRVIRDIFTEDFASLVVSGDAAWREVSRYVEDVAPDLAQRVSRWSAEDDVFAHHRIDEQLAKALDRKVWLPSGGSLVIDRTEAMTVVDVNTGKFVGSGGNLEETVTKNNIEAAEEIVRQLRLRDIGGIIVIDFIDMVLESNRDLVVRRLLECLGRDRTKHQVAEVTSLGLVQMTRKRVGSGLVEAFSEPCAACGGRGLILHDEPVAGSGERSEGGATSGRGGSGSAGGSRGRGRRGAGSGQSPEAARPASAEPPRSGPTAAQIAAAAHAAAIKRMAGEPGGEDAAFGAGGATEEATTAGGPAVATGTEPVALGTDEPEGAVGADEHSSVSAGPAVAVHGEVHAAEPVRTPDDGGSASGHAAPASDHDSAPGDVLPGDEVPGSGHLAPGETAAEDQQRSASPLEPTVASEGAAPASVPDAGERDAAPLVRPRRRRGRVVSPAGPPRVSSSSTEPAHPTE